MKKVFIAAALAAMIVSCGSKGNKSAEIIAESESDSIFAVNDHWVSYKHIAMKVFCQLPMPKESTIN